MNEGKLLHMLWTCPYLEDFWNFVICTVSDVIEAKIPEDPRVWILGDVNMLKVTKHKKYFISLASTAGKKIILVNWKSENPRSQKHWLNELSSCTPEKILYNVRRKPETYENMRLILGTSPFN